MRINAIVALASYVLALGAILFAREAFVSSHVRTGIFDVLSCWAWCDASSQKVHNSDDNKGNVADATRAAAVLLDGRTATLLNFSHALLVTIILGVFIFGFL